VNRDERSCVSYSLCRHEVLSQSTMPLIRASYEIFKFLAYLVAIPIQSFRRMKVVLYNMPQFVQILIVWPLDLSLSSRRNDWFHVMILSLSNNLIAIVPLVSEQVLFRNARRWLLSLSAVSCCTLIMTRTGMP
jgi:hypothetical protein